MKKALYFLTFLTALLVAAAAYPLQVTFLVGDVSLVREGKSIKPDISARVLSGDMVVTGKGGLAVLSYADGSEIRVEQYSRIRIEGRSAEDSESIAVVSGLVKAKFAKLLKGSERKVYSPTTVCSVRGTEFAVGVSDGADSLVLMKEGKLDVYNPYGRVFLKDGQTAEGDLSEHPVLKEDAGVNLGDWKGKKDKELEENPAEKGNRFRDYMGTFSDRNTKASRDLNALNGELKKGGMRDRKKVEKNLDRMDHLRDTVEDDMILGATANTSLDGILLKFQKDKKEIYDNFLRVKEESNRVLEQQRRNHEELQAVREAYQKAYKEIMGTHKKRMEEIKGGMKKEKGSPIDKGSPLIK